MYESRFKGRAFDMYLELRAEFGNVMADRRPILQVMGPPAARAQQGTPMDIGEFAPQGHKDLVISWSK